MRSGLIYILLLLMLTSCAGAGVARKNSTVRLTLAQTTDVHGNFYPYNFITRQPWDGSMARVATLLDSVRAARGEDAVILLDNGDILQGQPTAYYFNFIDTTGNHLVDDIYEFLGYDVATLGNHDVETGHKVYDRFVSHSPIPMLGANIIDTATGEPYLTPYHVIEREGVRIAILGMITPAIPAWLPQNIWSGLRFDDMEETARKWIPVIREREDPDLIIGLFHSGRNSETRTDGWIENASEQVARNVPGFDAVFFGHDHRKYCEIIENVDSQQVALLNPSSNAQYVALLDVELQFDSIGNIKSRTLTPRLAPVGHLEPSAKFMSRFEPQYQAVDSFVSRRIGTSTGEFVTRDAYFGPSAFMDLIHRLQLEIADAEISFAAPLSFDARIGAGPVLMSDMFSLYKYENLLYTMELTGREIKDYLEESYSLWTRTMASPDENMLNFGSDSPSPTDNRLRYPSYNFDSAAGIRYTVDLTKPKGQKITILGMENGEPFDLNRRYRVAVNSYRGNGGGDLLTKGAGLDHSELTSRIVRSTDKDLRYYLMQAIEQRDTIVPHRPDNWRFVPDSYLQSAAPRDSMLLFGSGDFSNQK